MKELEEARRLLRLVADRVAAALGALDEHPANIPVRPPPQPAPAEPDPIRDWGPAPDPTPVPLSPKASGDAPPLNMRKGYVDPQIWALLDVEAPARCRLDPLVPGAIAVWETGWLVDPNARAWLEGNNPGGMKQTDFAKSLPGYVVAGEDDRTYAAFDSWQNGFRALCSFLNQPRYNAARLSKDPAAQVLAIHKAGYAEMDSEWLSGVTSLVKRFQRERAAPNPPAGDLPARIRAAALNLPDPYPYQPETEGGELGCADVVSHALIEAGVIPERELAVAGLSKRLKGSGWRAANEPYRDGDVIVWGPRPGGTHGHVGVIIHEGGVVMTVQNSSSRRRVVHIPLAGYDRPIVEVLRAPGGSNA